MKFVQNTYMKQNKVCGPPAIQFVQRKYVLNNYVLLPFYLITLFTAHNFN